MIVGNGMLANSFRHLFENSEDVLIFASGVSNSRETDEREFRKESDLLQASLHGGAKRFVYFSSCGISAGEETPYFRHKSAMERLVMDRRGGVVFRLPQVVGHGGNPKTLTNFLYSSIRDGSHFSVLESAERNLIDLDHITDIVNRLITDPPANCIPIMSEKSMRVIEIVRIFEEVLVRKANIAMIPGGIPMPSDTRLIASVSTELGIDLTGNYAERVLRKYYCNAADSTS